MPPESDKIRALMEAFAAWAMPRFSASTVSQYAGVVQRLLAEGVDPSDVTASQRHIRERYSVTSWGVRFAALKAFHRFLGATPETAAHPDEFQAWLQTQGLKAMTAYRYSLCVSHIRQRLQLGDTLEAVLSYFGHAKPYPTAWGRYLQWMRDMSETVPEGWATEYEHHFPTRVIFAIRTLVQVLHWPVERLVTMHWGERITRPDGAITWPYRPGTANTHLHAALKGTAAFQALVTIGEWGRGTSSIDPAMPFLPSSPGSATPITLPALLAALAEIEDITLLDEKGRAAPPRRGPSQPPSQPPPIPSPPTLTKPLVPMPATPSTEPPPPPPAPPVFLVDGSVPRSNERGQEG